MKRKRNLKIFSLVILLLCITFAIFSVDAQAAKIKPKTGTYEKYFPGWRMGSYRTVVIKEITKKKVTFQIQYTSLSKIAYTKKIVGKRKGNTVTFTYKDTGWGEKGKGTMKLYNNYIKIKTKTTSRQLGFIGTDGKYFKLKLKNNKKKFAS